LEKGTKTLILVEEQKYIVGLDHCKEESLRCLYLWSGGPKHLPKNEGKLE
jgi:hypothetical protein